MTIRDLINMYTTRNTCRNALPCANMALKLPWYFYLLMEEPLGCYFQVRSPYYQATQCNQKASIPIYSRWKVRYQKGKKGQASTLITATTSFHLPEPVATDLTIKPDLILTKPKCSNQLNCAMVANANWWCCFQINLIKELIFELLALHVYGYPPNLMFFDIFGKSFFAL